MKKTRCMVMRAGTSKGVFFREEDMPINRALWDEFLLDVMGSPDKRQIDGMGGANSLTSKVAIIGKAKEEGVDVNYTFAQVSITDAVVDYKGNCGNMSAGVGPFAIEMGFVEAIEPITTVRINNTNTKKYIEAVVQVKDGEVVTEGDCEIPGVPGSGARIDLSFFEPQGAVTEKLLPTEKPKDIIETSIGKIEISIVDSANPLVYIRAEDIGLTGKEMPHEFSEGMLDLIEEIRSIACEMCGFASKEEATLKSPAVPKATVISSPKSYKDMTGKINESDDMNMLIRMMSMQKPHQALAITGAVCAAIAAKTEGTLVNEIITVNKKEILLGHPSGIMRATIKGEESIKGVTIERTSRKIMEGMIFTKKDYN